MAGVSAERLTDELKCTDMVGRICRKGLIYLIQREFGADQMLQIQLGHKVCNVAVKYRSDYSSW